MKKLILGMIVGACAGACAALLYAPQTGAQTRSQIRDKATKLGHDLEDLASSKGKHLSNKMQGYKHKMMKMAEGIRGRAERDMAGAGMGANISTPPRVLTLPK